MKKIDCACVIHGTMYDYVYVERLYNMLSRNLTPKVHLHVFTEAARPVGDSMHKHVLTDWANIKGPRRGWWYKMQMFDPSHNLGRLLYFDLDVVIVRNIDWIWQSKSDYFWALKDFKYLWRPGWTGINSSVMCWDTQKFGWIWERFQENNLDVTVRRWHGDQDFLSAMLVGNRELKYLDPARIKSWRWQCKDGGLDFKTRMYTAPGSGSHVDADTSVLIFHGKPNPHEIQDDLVQQHWR
jgi:hypothetical protein